MKKFLLMCFSFGFALSVWAQDRVVTGKLTSSEDGSALPGVNVLIKGTTTGTVTDAEGKYTLSAPSTGGVLVFSFIGLKTQEVAIGERSVLDVQLESDIAQLSEVVVTAQGIQTEKRGLGYAVSSVSGSVLQQRPETDVARMLTGKLPGVAITNTGGVAGQGTNIIIRGYTTITGNKQPLWVVDGVPFNSSTNQNGDFLGGGQATTSRFSDLDPNNIERIDVLKGLSAAVIYGQQGRNGVILVTTKNNGAIKEKKPEVTLTQSAFQTEIASLPDYQNNYGGGFNQNFGYFFSNWGPRFHNSSAPGVYGPDSVAHPYGRFGDPTLKAFFPQFQGKNTPYKAYDNTKFFQKGSLVSTTVNLNGATDKLAYNATLTRSKNTGFIKNNSVDKINFSLGISANITPKLNMQSSVLFATTDMQTPPITAGNGSGSASAVPSIFGDVFYSPRNIDLMGLPYVTPDGRSVYYRSGNDIQNPRWTQDYTKQTSNTSRFFGRNTFQYNFSKNFSLLYRVGLDTYSELQSFEVNKGGPALLNGLYRTINIKNTIWNHDVIANYKTTFAQDFHLTALAGGNIRVDKYAQDGYESVNQVVFGFMNHSNFLNHSPVNSFTGNNIQYQQNQTYGGVYANASVDYKDYVYVTLNARNDWSSTVEKANNSIFYKGASVSFVPTTAFGIESEKLNFLKVRASYGESAGFPNPYLTRNVLYSNTRAFQDASGGLVTTNAAFNNLGNTNLKPELQSEYEVGMEGKFFNNRLSFDLSMYTRKTTNLITQAPLDPATGFQNTNVNVGALNNKGIELSISGTPVIIGDFRWDITANYYAYRSDVLSLGYGLTRVLIPGGGYTNLGNFVVPGRPFGIIEGNYVQRDSKGNKQVDANGNYIPSGDIREIGNPIPNFTTSLINTFSYKRFSLMMQWDYRNGGSIYSTTAGTLIGRGVTADTGFDRSKTFVLPGVKQDGTPNNIQITPSDFYFTNVGFGPSELQIYDGTTIRLSQVQLSYSLPTSIFKKAFFKRASVSLSGQNLWFNAVNFPKHLHFDTNQVGTGVGNAQGLDFFTGPSARQYGGSISLTF